LTTIHKQKVNHADLKALYGSFEGDWLEPCPGVVRETMLDLRYLKDVGITDLLSLTEEMFNPMKAKALGLEVSHFPIRDMSVPSLQAAKQFCLDLDQKIEVQKTIAIHCKAGLGRTGTMLAVYYLWLAKGQKQHTSY
jgi:atypical dual specificity phosphatase